MKRVLLLAVIAIFVMMPLSSFARTAISDSELNSVIAQQGVTIDFSQFTLGAITITTASWGDSNGFTGYTSAGYVGASMTMSSNFLTLGGALTIDVGTTGGVTAIGIGLPTITIGGEITQTIKLAASADLATTPTTLGSMYMSGISISPVGTLIIKAHN